MDCSDEEGRLGGSKLLMGEGLTVGGCCELEEGGIRWKLAHPPAHRPQGRRPGTEEWGPQMYLSRECEEHHRRRLVVLPPGP